FPSSPSQWPSAACFDANQFRPAMVPLSRASLGFSRFSLGAVPMTGIDRSSWAAQSMASSSREIDIGNRKWARFMVLLDEMNGIEWHATLRAAIAASQGDSMLSAIVERNKDVLKPNRFASEHARRGTEGESGGCRAGIPRKRPGRVR